jgi:mono/diheme cytochrome c family protein
MKKTLSVAIAALVVVGTVGCGPAFATGDAEQLALGRQLFNQTAVPACALCHTLKDAGSEGAIGPVLDEIKPNAQRLITAMRNGIGQMPSFADSLSEAQIQAIANYVSKVTGAEK